MPANARGKLRRRVRTGLLVAHTMRPSAKPINCTGSTGADRRRRRGNGRLDAPARDRAGRGPRGARRAGSGGAHGASSPRASFVDPHAGSAQGRGRSSSCARRSRALKRRHSLLLFAAMLTVLVTALVLGVFIPVVQATTGAANEVRARAGGRLPGVRRQAGRHSTGSGAWLSRSEPTVGKLRVSSPRTWPTTKKKKRMTRTPTSSCWGSNPLPEHSDRVTPKHPGPHRQAAGRAGAVCRPRARAR